MEEISNYQDNGNGEDKPSVTTIVEETLLVNNAMTVIQEPQISKNQLKKLKKKELRDAITAQRKEGRREERRERRQKQRMVKQEKQDKEKESGELPKKHIDPCDIDIKCIIDCEFDDLMNDKEIFSLAAQITTCHSVNKRARNRMNICITSLNKKLLERTKLMHGDNYKNWKRMAVSSESYSFSDEEVTSGKVIYLTADASETIESLQEGYTYIIGGIVDKNRHKGICYNKAVSQDIRTAKLPIEEYIQMKSRCVLTVNHVFEIMSKWLEYKDWYNAFMEIIPQRKRTDNDPLKVENNESNVIESNNKNNKPMEEFKDGKKEEDGQVHVT